MKKQINVTDGMISEFKRFVIAYIVIAVGINVFTLFKFGIDSFYIVFIISLAFFFAAAFLVARFSKVK